MHVPITSSLLRDISFDLAGIFDSTHSFGILAGWYPGGIGPPVAVDVIVFIDDVLLQEANQAIEGQEIRVLGKQDDFERTVYGGVDVDYDDVLVWSDTAYRIKSIQPDGTGIIEFIVALAEDVVV